MLMQEGCSKYDGKGKIWNRKGQTP